MGHNSNKTTGYDIILFAVYAEMNINIKCYSKNTTQPVLTLPVIIAY